MATRGCPTNLGPNWSPQQLQDYFNYGAHWSATSPEAAAFIHAEAIERENSGLCRIVRWKDIKNDPPPNLKLSPAAAVPHKSKTFRQLLDLTFALQAPDGTFYTPDNGAPPDPNLPSHSQFEMGNVTSRIIWQMARATQDLPFFFAKFDSKDGFWRINVKDGEEWNFAYLLPQRTPNDDILLVVPNSCQMGWQRSPPLLWCGH
jgi:hypothetical protein